MVYASNAEPIIWIAESGPPLALDNTIDPCVTVKLLLAKIPMPVVATMVWLPGAVLAGMVIIVEKKPLPSVVISCSVEMSVVLSQVKLTSELAPKLVPDTITLVLAWLLVVLKDKEGAAMV